MYKRYPQVVDAISKHISTIEKDTAISFNEDELTFIAIHFASSMERGATNKQLMIKSCLTLWIRYWHISTFKIKIKSSLSRI